MDSYAISDVDALQAVLTGHAQLSDPLRARRLAAVGTARRHAANASKTKQTKPNQNSLWLKPLWLEQETEERPARGLASQPGIRPLNAPLKTKVWRQLAVRARAQGLVWETLPLSTHGNGPSLAANWATAFGRAFGALRSSGERNGGFETIRVSCNTKAWLARAPSSFLLRPEREEDTEALAFDEGWEQAVAAMGEQDAPTPAV
eukprot:6202685-Pleurochrysis_carterae.AAC.1